MQRTHTLCVVPASSISMLVKLCATRLLILGLIGSRKVASTWNVASVEGGMAWSASEITATSVATSSTTLEPGVRLANCFEVVNEWPIIRLVRPLLELLTRRILWALSNMMSRLRASVTHVIWVQGSGTGGIATAWGLPETATSSPLVISFPIIVPETSSALSSCASTSPRTSRQVTSKRITKLAAIRLSLLLILGWLVVILLLGILLYLFSSFNYFLANNRSNNLLNFLLDYWNRLCLLLLYNLLRLGRSRRDPLRLLEAR